MSKVVFLLEEQSMAHFLRAVLKRIFPEKIERLDWQLIPFEGKDDLRKGAVETIQNWREPDVRFVIIRDKDSADCRAVKKQMQSLATKAGRADTVVRIACEELESWYLGDAQNLAAEYENVSLEKIIRSDADSITKPSKLLAEKISDFTKSDAARRMGARISVEPTTQSCSYNHLLKSIRNLLSAQ